MSASAVYDVYGLALAAANELGARLPLWALPRQPSEQVLQWHLEPHPPATNLPAEAQLLYRSPLENEGTPQCRLYAVAGAECMLFASGIQVTLHFSPPREGTSSGSASNEPRIAQLSAALPRPSFRFLAELHLLGPVAAYLLERQAVPVLHASAVQIPGLGAMGFLANHGGGKSSLAAAMLRGGAELITDDLLPLDLGSESERDAPWNGTSPQSGSIWGRRGPFHLRLWPDAAQALSGSHAAEPILPGHAKLRVPVGLGYWGRIASRQEPIRVLYLPQRGGDTVRITPITRRDALMQLVRCSFTPYLVEARGMQARRLDTLMEVLARVEVRRLDYPAGFSRLEEVASRVRSDLASGPWP